MKQAKIIMYGNVQGVGFRFLAQRIGRQIGVRGWVRNEDDGTVIALVEGEEEKIIEFAKRIKNIHSSFGPDVEKLEIKYKKEIKNYTCADFVIAF
ncbi:MAG: acylphosphatase [Candidatus Micrarchaeota archaeon]